VYQIDRKEDRLKTVFSAELCNVDAFCEDLKRMMADKRLNELVFTTQLLLREALNNAVIHGCGYGSGKLIECVIELGGDYVTAQVMDEGEGFDWAKTGLKKTDVGADSGRGLPIMKEYADEVLFNEKGNGLKLKIRKPIRREE
jgi:serine/threonine-protein kinase RsbW